MRTAASVTLKGQDLLVSMKLAVAPGPRWTYEALGNSLRLSPSEAREALLRAEVAGLAFAKDRRANHPALLEFLVHGARYSFPPIRGRRGRGVPTYIGALPLSDHLVANEDADLVWPSPQGTARGETLAAIYPSVPHAAEQDVDLYALLVLLDGIRVGGPRVRAIAQGLLEDRLQ